MNQRFESAVFRSPDMCGNCEKDTKHKICETCSEYGKGGRCDIVASCFCNVLADMIFYPKADFWCKLWAPIVRDK
jgi:hypothetical protein